MLTIQLLRLGEETTSATYLWGGLFAPEYLDTGRKVQRDESEMAGNDLVPWRLVPDR